jgi:Flp pilus assembly protein TadD
MKWLHAPETARVRKIMRKPLMLSLATVLVLVQPAVQAAAMPQAAKSAARAEAALSKGKLIVALAEAEAAVEAAPGDAGYRMLLGRAYLQNGRFRAAAASFKDALDLDPARGSAALNLALTRIGLGDQDGARAVLEANGASIPSGDRGLALSLAGDTAGGVMLLEEAVRNGLADAKTRQNLALAYALAGRWAEAKLMASYDLEPAVLSQRIMEWSRFTREGQASAQVAALLGVRPGEDAGQPVRLALRAPAAPEVQVASAPPAPLPMPVLPDAQPVSLETATAAIAEAQVLFAPEAVQDYSPRSEIVQAITQPRAPRPARFQRAAFVVPTGGRFVVQIGAFDSIGVAQDAWGRAAARIDTLRGFTPTTATIKLGSTTFYRLSLSGFQTRANAVNFCEDFRTRGGKCFVRESAGDAPLQWARKSTGPKFASR